MICLGTHTGSFITNSLLSNVEKSSYLPLYNPLAISGMQPLHVIPEIPHTFTSSYIFPLSRNAPEKTEEAPPPLPPIKMSAATAAVGPCFSTAAAPSKHLYSDAGLFRSVTCLRAARMPSLAHLSEHLRMGAGQKRLPTQKIWAAVAQEEAEAEAEQVVEEEVVVEESGGDGGGEGEAEGGGQNTKLYFGNLPYNCDSAQLAGIVQEYASPEMVEVLYDRDTGRSRGFAFVTMSSVEDCEAVIQNLDGSQYGGRTMRVNFSDKPKPRVPLYPETEYKLFIGNLSWSVTSESLTAVFQEHGNVVGARVLYDGDTGQSRGYGFVCYSTKQEMDAALESLNGVELDGRSMRISLALGKKS